MPEIAPPPQPTQLIVFADDWGRHPSSSQHLVRELLPHYPTLWVNTIGTRKPTLSLSDIKRGTGLVASWFISRRQTDGGLPENLEVIAPKMYPGYRTTWQRKLNARRVAQAVEAHLLPGHRHVVVTTLPTTADLIPKLDADRWVYYCVDDYSKWPGTDHAVMEEMEQQLASRCDAAVAVSEVLHERLAGMGRQAGLLPHGVHAEHWQTPSAQSSIHADWPDDSQPIALFWGLVDERLDSQWVWQLATDSQCRIVLAGPRAGSAETGLIESRCLMPGPIDFNDLPAHAAASQVLIMPYIDAPVTRAMQPLKLLEYLATMKPVVVRDLPSTRPWADCCDLASNTEQFLRLVNLRVQTGTPPDQLDARKRRLPGESWTAKATQLATIINAG